MEMTKQLDAAILDYIVKLHKYETTKFLVNSMREKLNNAGFTNAEAVQWGNITTHFAMASMEKQVAEQRILLVIRSEAFPVTDENGDSV